MTGYSEVNTAVTDSGISVLHYNEISARKLVQAAHLMEFNELSERNAIKRQTSHFTFLSHFSMFYCFFMRTFSEVFPSQPNRHTMFKQVFDHSQLI